MPQSGCLAGAKTGEDGDMLPGWSANLHGFSQAFIITNGAGPDKLLVHVFLGSGRMEFLDKGENGVKAPIYDEPGLSISFYFQFCLLRSQGREEPPCSGLQCIG